MSQECDRYRQRRHFLQKSIEKYLVDLFVIYSVYFKCSFKMYDRRARPLLALIQRRRRLISEVKGRAVCNHWMIKTGSFHNKIARACLGCWMTPAINNGGNRNKQGFCDSGSLGGQQFFE